jgi:hypothetical protein
LSGVINRSRRNPKGNGAFRINAGYSVCKWVLFNHQAGLNVVSINIKRNFIPVKGYFIVIPALPS